MKQGRRANHGDDTSACGAGRMRRCRKSMNVAVFDGTNSRAGQMA